MCPATIRDVDESECFAYERIQGRHKGNQKDISAGGPGPVRQQLEKAGRPGGGRLHRTHLSIGEDSTDPSSTWEAGRGRQRGQET